MTTEAEIRQTTEAFAKAARALCDTLENPPKDPGYAIRLLRDQLIEVYALALRLGPRGSNFKEQDLDEVYPVAPDEVQRVYENVSKLVEQRHYLMVFDSRLDNSEEPVVGDLADDFTDIYLDIRPALQAWEAGDDCLDDILFAWFGVNFGSHWGQHAITASRALFDMTCSNRLDWVAKETEKSD